MIRPATDADVGWLTDLEELVFGRDAWSRRLVHDGLPGTLVQPSTGFVVVSVAGETADLQRIAVDPGRRRTGLGRDLLGRAVEAAKDAGAERMLLEVRAENLTAVAFYASSGFAEIDRRRRYYRDGAEAIVMAREV